MLGSFIDFINKKYGSKRGLLSAIKYWLLYQSGTYNELQQIDWRKVQRVVFICSGNICRSPLAELFGRAVGLQAISAGVDCAGGAPADPRAVRFAVAQGRDLSRHTSTNISQLQLTEHDLVVGMEPVHLHHPALGPSRLAQVTLLGLWSDRLQTYIHDPYSADEQYFVACSEYVITATAALAKKVSYRPELSAIDQ